jgi:putative NADH-flavin reductase
MSRIVEASSAADSCKIQSQGSQRLAILGATGRTGRLLLGQAEARSLEVNALARIPAELGDLRGTVNVVEGSAIDPDAVERVVAGCSSILCAIGQVRDSPTDLLTRTTLNMVDAMKKLSVKRLVILSNTAIEDPTDSPPLVQRMLRVALAAMNGKLKQDSIGAAKVLAGSGLDWTLVRAPILTDGPKTGRYRVGPLTKGMPLRVSRADVAEFMLSCAVEGKFVRERPAIGGGS